MSITRPEININDSVLDMLLLMSEGNPGAATVLVQIMNKYDAGAMLVFILDDMNIRGPQIWVGYKNACHEDLDEFCRRIKTRDQEIINIINEELSRDNSFKWIAVKGGASSHGYRDKCRK